MKTIANPQKQAAGFSLIEALVVAAVTSLFFTGLFGSLQYSLELIANSRAKMTALTVANDQMEYIRSLSYDAAGTVAGIPAGSLPQVSTTTLNGIEFTKRILIEYIDDDADGVGAADSNTITTDYKQAKVSVTWNIKGEAREVFLVSNIIPRSIESNVGGGTLRVNVLDAAVAPLSGASVRVVNNTLVPNIDITRITDAAGIALFGGAPAGPDYEIFVTGAGYSSDQTYVATTSLPYPTNQPVAVVEADISTKNFFIDEVSSLTVRTLGEKTIKIITEDFSNTSGIATSTDITVSSSSAMLVFSGSEYMPVGSFFLTPVSPTPLEAWENINISGAVPLSTAVTLRLYTGTSTFTLIPDSDLPGNGIGFPLGVTDISDLSVAAYPSFAVGVTLETADTNITPAIDEVLVSYLESETSIAGVTLDMQGTKTIGTNSMGELVYKMSEAVVTDGTGEYVWPTLEWDAYTFTPTGYDVAEACSNNPLVVDPGSTITLELVLAANTTNTLRVVAQSVSGTKLMGAEVTLSRPGFSEVLTTSACGQVFFNGLSSETDYELTVAPDGYTAQTLTSFSIAGDEVTVVNF